MITPERIKEIDEELSSVADIERHANGTYCHFGALRGARCDCVYGMTRELVSELKDSISREKKHREEIERFASKLTKWLGDAIEA